MKAAGFQFPQREDLRVPVTVYAPVAKFAQLGEPPPVVVWKAQLGREGTVSGREQRMLDRQHGVERIVVGEADLLDQVVAHLVEEQLPTHGRDHQLGKHVQREIVSGHRSGSAWTSSTSRS